jgi:methylated-DNA-[protein]-cysteine S-methyltransferase
MDKLLQRHYGHVILQIPPKTTQAFKALQAYFSGDLAAVSHLRPATNGTDFQKKVWDALRNIPIGQTASYGELAAKIGKPTAARAVGLANGSNPIAIVVPCHRVIGANASLTGFAGGLERKQWLLEHENAFSA